jgi:hypothetical protein
MHEKGTWGLGVPNLKDLNLCLLGSWVKRYIKDENRLWRSIVERKYCRHGSIFYSDHSHASPFWKGVIMATHVVKFGYRWIPGDGRKIRLCEDIWFGTAPLAVQFWELYCVCNEKVKTLAEIWVERELRLSFRRTFTEPMMQLWDELVSIVEQITLNDESDALVWSYEKSGVYSSQSFYTIINFRGVKPIYIPAIWGVQVPSKIQLFLWLLCHNKLATLDNLNRKGMNKPVQCCFCEENESIHHLLFECAVTRVVWEYVSEIVGCRLGEDYLSIATKWLHKEKYHCTNIFSATVMRSIWLIRNDCVFNNQVWSDVKLVLRRIQKLILEWKPIIKEKMI